MSEVLRIREMCEDERPREKMMKKGVKSLSDAELLAIMIRTGDKNNNAVTLSSKVLTLSKHGVRGLTDLSLDELCSIDGIGPSKATIIKAALELGVRVSQYLPNRFKINNPWDVYSYYMEELRYLKKEVFKVILLNTKNEIISDIDVSVGSLNSSIVHPREVFILMHNHPSGNPDPSKEDIMITKRLNECGKILGINVLDHIVIGDGSYYSLKENNLF